MAFYGLAHKFQKYVTNVSLQFLVILLLGNCMSPLKMAVNDPTSCLE